MRDRGGAIEAMGAGDDCSGGRVLAVLSCRSTPAGPRLKQSAQTQQLHRSYPPGACAWHAPRAPWITAPHQLAGVRIGRGNRVSFGSGLTPLQRLAHRCPQIPCRHGPSRAHLRCRIYDCRRSLRARSIDQPLPCWGESIYAGLAVDCFTAPPRRSNGHGWPRTGISDTSNLPDSRPPLREDTR